MKVSKWLLVVALSLSIGAHWTLMQSAAWCGMIVNYSQGSTLKDGLEKTFDGKHPCKWCKIVAEGKKSEKKEDSQLKVTKLDVFSVCEGNALIAPPTLPGNFRTDFFSSSRTETPLSPPPRLA